MQFQYDFIAMFALYFINSSTEMHFDYASLE